MAAVSDASRRAGKKIRDETRPPGRPGRERATATATATGETERRAESRGYEAHLATCDTSYPSRTLVEEGELCVGMATL